MRAHMTQLHPQTLSNLIEVVMRLWDRYKGFIGRHTFWYYSPVPPSPTRTSLKVGMSAEASAAAGAAGAAIVRSALLSFL